ncbi:MAG: metallophosphoesterase [Bacteroidota bacterium]
MKRRKFLRLLGGTATLIGLYTWQLEPFWLEFVHRELPIAYLPSALAGKRLVQISDLHVGEKVSSTYLRRSLRQAQAYEPDVVVYTGDFVSYESARQLTDLRAVMQDAAQGKLATLAILGNHDYGVNWRERHVADDIVGILAENGITTLRNEAMDIAGLNVIGVDDLWGTNFAPEKALSHYAPNQANLVLCHNPDVCDLDVWNHYRGWILSGHTHGGQCKPPFLPPPILPVQNETYTSGAFDLGDGRNLYVNRALGFSRQVRFNVRPEISVFTLRAVLP